MDNNFGSNGEITANGKYAVTFRPDGDGEDTWFEKIIYAELTQADPTEAPTEQPTEAPTALRFSTPAQQPSPMQI